jgi:hypothetical protein
MKVTELKSGKKYKASLKGVPHLGTFSVDDDGTLYCITDSGTVYRDDSTYNILIKLEFEEVENWEYSRRHEALNAWAKGKVIKCKTCALTYTYDETSMSINLRRSMLISGQWFVRKDS